eukprot:TRINITY_DN7138_c0_g2_i2.p3 TRINITY_DN7138_c0_g2~~TRINITY_DN7138_c0_g2_i2.p3  ORF type:complete len:101 (+),score=33.36 TRINITY_DN7138_c0_g2_i2:766-1068(+)
MAKRSQTCLGWATQEATEVACAGISLLLYAACFGDAANKENVVLPSGATVTAAKSVDANEQQRTSGAAASSEDAPKQKRLPRQQTKRDGGAVQRKRRCDV